MKIFFRVLGAASALVLTFGCREATSPAGIQLGVWVPDRSAVLAHEYYSGLVDSARVVVADAETWSALWAQIFVGTQPFPPLPAVDFASDRLLVAAMGRRPTGGYSINIDSVARSQGGTVVYVTATAPGSNCGTTQSLTSPVHVVRLCQPPEPITFQDQNVVIDCQ